MGRGLPEKSAMPGKRKLTRYIFIFTLMILAFIILFVPVRRRFTIIEEKTGRILYSCNVKPGTTFCVSYVHSVNNSPVSDEFEVDEEYRLVLKKTVFHSFGAGIQFEAESGQKLTVYDDRLELGNIDRRLDQYLLFVGTVARHTFAMNGVTFRLDSLVRPQTAVRFEVRRLPLIRHISFREEKTDVCAA